MCNCNKKKKKKLKSLIRFHSANETGNSNRGRWKKRKKEKKEKYTRNYRSQNIRIINVFLESVLSESLPALGITVHLTSLGCTPKLCWSLDLLWGQLRF